MKFVMDKEQKKEGKIKKGECEQKKCRLLRGNECERKKLIKTCEHSQRLIDKTALMVMMILIAVDKLEPAEEDSWNGSTWTGAHVSALKYACSGWVISGA